MNTKTPFFVLISILALSLIPFAAAVGISPGITIIDAKPGLEMELGYRAINPGAKFPSPVFVNFKESNDPIYKYLSITENNRFIIPVGGSIDFSAHLALPDPLPEDITPGDHDFYVGVSDDANNLPSSSITVVANSYALLRIKIPYPGKFVVLSMRTQDVEKGKGVPVSLDVKSEGTQTINTITALGDVYSEGQQVLTLTPKTETNLLSQDSRTISWNIDTKNLPAGEYIVKMHVVYDEETKDTETSFRVGGEDISVVSIPAEIQTGAIRKFDIVVKSLWNNFLTDVYADITLLKGDLKIDSFKTAPIDKMGPWAEEHLTGYIDTTTLEPGPYKALITMHFGNKQKNFTGDVKLVKGTPSTERASAFSGPNKLTLIIFGAGVLIAALVSINLYLLFGRKKKQQ